MIDNSKEYILCAAILFDTEPEPTLICGYRHDNCIFQANRMEGMKNTEGHIYPYHQGFLTSRERFVNRREAAAIAFEVGQITAYQDHATPLFSEDLY